MHREQHHDAIIDLFIILYLSICHFLEVSVTIVHQEFLVCSVQEIRVRLYFLHTLVLDINIMELMKCSKQVKAYTALLRFLKTVKMHNPQA